MKPKTDLQKSHSVWSNFKLTIICILLGVLVPASFVALAFTLVNDAVIFKILGGGLLIADLVLLFIISKFKR